MDYNLTRLQKAIRGWKIWQYETAIDKQARHCSCEDRTHWFENIAKEANEAAAKGDSKTLYKLIDKLGPPKSSLISGVNNKHGLPCATAQEELDQWEQY